MTRSVIVLAMLSLVLGLPAAVGVGVGAEKTVRIGAVLPVTGSAAFLGEPMKKATQLFVEQLNKAGGIGGAPVELIVYDSVGDSTKAVTATKRLIEQDRVVAVTGIGSSSNALAIIPFVERGETPLFVVAVHREISKPTKKWVFQTVNVLDQEVERTLGFLRSKGVTKAAVLIVSDARGVGAKDEFVRQAKDFGIELATIESFGPSDTDVTPQLTRIKGGGAQAVISAVSTSAAAIVAKNHAQLGMRQLLLMGTGFSLKFAELAGRAANGIVFPTYKVYLTEEALSDRDPQREVVLKYRRDYQAKFGEPAEVFGALQYDGLLMLGAALRAVGPDRAKVRDWVEANVRSFVGPGGVYTFGPNEHNGYAIESLVMVEVIDDGKGIRSAR